MITVKECDRDLLALRARALARPVQVPGEGPLTLSDGGRATLELLMFCEGGTTLALESRYVREVIGGPRVTPLPGAPSHLLGAFSLRGEILPLFDGAHIFSQCSLPADRDVLASHVLVLGQDRSEVGVLVNQALGVSNLSRTSLHAPPAGLPFALYASILGVTDEALVCLDGKTYLCHPALRIAPTPSLSGGLHP